MRSRSLKPELYAKSSVSENKVTARGINVTQRKASSESVVKLSDERPEREEISSLSKVDRAKSF